MATLKKVTRSAQRGGQAGFTLIELMIVVAIIGILAAIAIPAYQDYTIRARVSESASVSSPVRTAFGVYLSEVGALPNTFADVNAYVTTTDTAYQTKYVQSVAVANGEIRVTMRDITELGDAGGANVIWAPRYVSGASALDWVISDGSSMLNKYRPRAQ